MTATRSHISATTPRSWVMRMIAVPVSSLEVAHQVEDLGLDRDVEGGRRLVGDEQLGLAGEGHRDHHALGHAARHLVREGLEAALRIGDADHLAAARAPAPARPSRSCLRWISRTSPIWRPTSMTGFSDDVGCWKIIEIRSPRMLAHLVVGDASAGPSPSKRTSPASIRPGWRRAAGSTATVTLLPQPDSPTRPMISPRSTWKSMPSTARTTPSRV